MAFSQLPRLPSSRKPRRLVPGRCGRFVTVVAVFILALCSGGFHLWTPGEGNAPLRSHTSVTGWEPGVLVVSFSTTLEKVRKNITHEGRQHDLSP